MCDKHKVGKVLMELVGKRATWDVGIQAIFEEVAFKQTREMGKHQPHEK